MLTCTAPLFMHLHMVQTAEQRLRKQGWMWESVSDSPALQEEVSARDAARAALQQLTEFLGTRHGTGQAFCITAATRESLCSGSSSLAAENACMRSLE